jgi:Ca2+-binding EF-hand superfamily protein
MKKKLVGIASLVTFAGVVLILPQLGVGQQPGGGKGQFGGGKGQFGGPGGMKMDPRQLFDMIAKGNDYININELQMGRKQAQQWAQDNGITNGQLTRDQFSQYLNFAMARQQGGGPGGGGGNNNGGGNVQMTPEEMDQMAITRFKRGDTSGDGVLNEDEINAMSPKFAEVWKKWDTNKDGVIDLEEYKAYFRDVMAQRLAMNNNNQSGPTSKVEIVTEEDWEKRPTVYRAGHLPKELPAWFAMYDTDQDGQVGLYEWRRAGQPFDRFQEMDRNGDGLLTAEEVLYFMKLHPEVYGPVRSDDSSTSMTMGNNTWQQWQPPQQQWPGKGGPGGMQFRGMGGQMGMNPQWQNPQWQNNQQQNNNPRVGRGYDPNNPQGGPGMKGPKGGNGGGKGGKGNRGNGGNPGDE